jgi:integrase
LGDDTAIPIPIPFTQGGSSMPSIVEKKKVFDGKGEVCRFAHRDGFFYREHIKGTTRYSVKKIEGASSLEEAERLAHIPFSEIRQQESNPVYQLVTTKTKPVAAVSSRKKSCKLETAIYDYLKWRKQLYESGQLPFNSYSRKKYIITNHLLPYLCHKGVFYSREIKQDTFHDWQLFRKPGTAITTLITERCAVVHFLAKWLKNKGYLDETLDFEELFQIGRVREEDLLANPAINPDDWNLITKTIRSWARGKAAQHTHRGWYWRHLFWNWCLICKNCGARPEELIKLRWGEVEIIDEGRFSQSTLDRWIEWINQPPSGAEDFDRYIIERFQEEYPVKTKNGELTEADLTEEERQELGRQEKLVAYLTLKSSKTGKIRETPSNVGREFKRWGKFQKEYLAKHFPHIKVSEKDYVFGLATKEMRPHSYSQYWQAWNEIRDSCSHEFKGNRFALDEPYTPYSMRTTYIENQLLNDTPIADVARACGNSPDVIARHYSRMDLRKKQEQLTSIPYGKKKEPKKHVIKPYE